MIELKNITKKYGDLTAVDDLSLTINTGEIVGLLGPNGAGKSTTMKITTGFLIPDSGDVVIEGENVKDNLISAKQKIGYMPENNPLYKEMIVKEAISYALDLHGIPSELHKEKINYVVKATGLQSVYYKPIAELSKGYKQRVGLAQVLVHDPKILILDEPTEGLDPNQRAEIRNLIRDIGKDRTVIISTHVMQEVEAMCSRIVIINKGKVVKDGSKEEIAKGDSDTHIVNLKFKSKNKLNLKTLFKGSKIEHEIFVNGIYEVKANVKNIDSFAETFSKVAKENDFIVYEFKPEQQNLEDLFRELTK